MVDTSMIDLPDLIEQRAGIRLGKAYGTGVKRTRKGPCPFCKQGTDRFAVFVNGVPQHYYCGIHGSSGCGAHGDAVTFLREYEGLNYSQACDELGIDPGSEYARRASSTLDSRREKPPCKDWQKQACAVIDLAQNILKSNKGAYAREYLHARGFTDEIIEKKRLGCIPLNSEGKWFLETFEQWGLKQEDSPDKKGVWLYEGILIPCYESDTIWKLTVRRLTGLKEDDPKYLDILGSGEGLFNVDAIRQDHPVVICEGPFDALAGIQTCSDLAAFVATGSVARGRILRWEMRFNVASRVLIAYDDDDAGNTGAEHWLKTLPHAVQWLPWAHDINEMLTDGTDLRAWLTMGMASAALEQKTAKVAPPVAPSSDEQPLPAVPDEAPPAQPIESEPSPAIPVLICISCGREDTHPDESFFFDNDGTCYCPTCWTHRSSASSEADAPGLDSETSAQFLETIQRVMVEKLPGWKVELVSKDVTLAQRVGDMRAKVREHDQAMWKLARAKAARPKSEAWTREQVRSKHPGEWDEEETEIEPNPDAFPADTELLTALEHKWHSDEVEMPFWRAICGYGPGTITRKECLRRLQEALVSPDPTFQWEARQDLYSRLRVIMPGLRHQLYRVV